MISVIVPVYNTERYLPKCLDSLLCQTYENLELVLVNDGSTDGSLAMLRDYEKRDCRVKVIDQANAGVSTARNVGLAIATGDFVTFVDSDDWVEPNLLETLLRNLQENEADVSCCQYSGYRAGTLPKLTVWDTAQCLEEFIKHQKIGGTLCTKLFSNSLVQRVTLNPQIKYGEDALFSWQVLQNAKRIVVCDEVLYHYRGYAESSSGGVFKPIRMDCIKVWGTIVQEAESVSPHFGRLAHEQLGNMCFHEWYFLVYTGYRSAECENRLLEVLKDEKSAVLSSAWIDRRTKAFVRLTLANRWIAKQMILARKKIRVLTAAN